MLNKKTIKSKVIADYKSGTPVREISTTYGIAQSTLYNWVNNARIERRNNEPFTNREEVLALYERGYSAKQISEQTGVPLNTCYAWKSRNKQEAVPAPVPLAVQMKRNIINSISDGHSKHEVSKSYNVSMNDINLIIEEYKDGRLDKPQIAIKAQPAIQTMTIDALDKFTDVFKLLVGNGIDIDKSVDVAKQLSVKMK